MAAETNRLFLSSVPRQQILISDPISSEQVQGAADCDVDVSLADFSDLFQVAHARRAAGVGNRQAVSLAHQFDEFEIDASAKSLDIGRVNQKLVRVLRQSI